MSFMNAFACNCAHQQASVTAGSNRMTQPAKVNASPMKSVAPQLPWQFKAIKGQRGQCSQTCFKGEGNCRKTAVCLTRLCNWNAPSMARLAQRAVDSRTLCLYVSEQRHEENLYFSLHLCVPIALRLLYVCLCSGAWSYCCSIGSWAERPWADNSLPVCVYIHECIREYNIYIC